MYTHTHARAFYFPTSYDGGPDDYDDDDHHHHHRDHRLYPAARIKFTQCGSPGPTIPFVPFRLARSPAAGRSLSRFKRVTNVVARTRCETRKRQSHTHTQTEYFFILFNIVTITAREIIAIGYNIIIIILCEIYIIYNNNNNNTKRASYSDHFYTRR
uniref:Uncharacterized protein n=1 Tax=Schizaphis graminum TaxID=13262 RepID=A0A2S2NE23_SCHGA